ncbi:ABC transporter permease [Lacibacterium aquatile]|uniref:Transport permease protein n=1 Tax=Lacibacterium aquatile TaxID=1168082 RepID=A0ABW5DTW5_9PROT
MKRSSALKVQGRVIFAIIMREIKIRYGRQRLGYLWAVIEPLVYIVSILIIFDVMGRKIRSGLPLAPFVVSAVVPFLTFRNTAQRVMMSSHNNRAILAYPQIKVMDIIIGRTLLEIANSFCVLMIFIAGMTLTGLSPWPSNILGVVMSVFLAAFLGMSLGSVLNTIGQYTTSIEKIFPPILRVMVLFSGLFYTAAELPGVIRDILLMNPIFHVIEYSRESYFENLRVFADIPFIFYCGVPLLFIGFITEKTASRQATLE